MLVVVEDDALCKELDCGEERHKVEVLLRLCASEQRLLNQLPSLPA